ncbi:unnamed protein product [Prunus brigantina]
MVGDSEENDDCVMADEMIYIPEVRNEERPKVGMKFDSLDFVYDFYNRYALLAGFSIRRHSSGKEKYSKEILRKEFVCCKQGVFKKEEPRVIKRHRGISRCGCKARVVVVKVSGCKQYVFSLVVEGHNHTMTPSERVHFMRSHRHISEPAKLLTKQLGSADIPTHKKMSILEVQSGGMEKIGFTKKDIYNFEYYESGLMKNHDVELVTEYFLAEQKNNRSFYFKIEGDSNDRLTRCFWADATSRRAYGFYGDVVGLDTTFNTNRYGLPFAPMLGVNNHGQTIVLACAFLSKETTESFIWMFEEFKKAMPGGEPKMIITDQDATMARAIFEVFPTTFHRLCIWHITTKFSDKLPRAAYEEYWKEFKETIWEIDNIDEFEEKWHAIVIKSGLTDHPWLSSVFDLRKSWVPAYVKHVFAAGMSSSQRAEGSHTFFKQYISRRNSLMDFITRFQRALSHQRQNELLADHIDAFEKPQCALLMTMDKQIAEIYTKAMFQKFEQELMQSLPCFMELKMDDASKAIYKVSERKRGKTRVTEVVYDKYSDQWSCSCKGFEFIGILCCHALALLKREQIEYLPNKYILNRWKKTAKSGFVSDSNGNEIKDCENSSLLIKRSRMFRLASDVIEHALMSEEGCELLSNNLNDTRVTLELLNDGVGPSEVGGSSSQTRYLKDPKRVTHKGSSKRVKGAKEKRMERGIRHCRQCGQTSHDIRRCPRMANTTTSPSNNEESTPINLSDPLFDEFDSMHGPTK